MAPTRRYTSGVAQNSSPKLKAMILAAGPGTRLRPLTDTTPKPLIEVRGAPLIVHQIGWLLKAGIRDIVINVHHLADQLIDRLGTGSRFGVQITFSREFELLNTGGGIVNALPLLGGHPFLLLNGDVWTNYPLTRLVRRRTNHGHLVLIPVNNESNRDFALDGEIVKRFTDSSCHDLTYSGIAVLHPSIFRARQAKPFSLTRDLVFDLIHQQKITGEIFDGDWVDIGSLDNLSKLRDSAQPSSTKNC